MSDWKLGTVAMVRRTSSTHGVTEDVCLRGTNYVGNDVWWGQGGWLLEGDIKSVRPLVVIDPENREQVCHLTALYRGVLYPDKIDVDDMQAALREFAKPEPPKPEEPTALGAVVRDCVGQVWVRYKTYGNFPWRRNLPGEPNAAQATRWWSDIEAVEVLSEGVRP